MSKRQTSLARSACPPTSSSSLVCSVESCPPKINSHDLSLPCPLACRNRAVGTTSLGPNLNQQAGYKSS
eukprot:624047-Prorocentrum_minimum.AAC.2